MKTITYPVRVTYWSGTTQHTGQATTVRGAMRIAGRNRNALPPTFRDAAGVDLFPQPLPEGGCGLSPEDLSVVFC